MGAAFDHATLVEHEQHVGAQDGGQSMGDVSDVRSVLREFRDAALERVPPSSADAADAARLPRGTVRVLRRLPGDTRCLNQSLVLSALLARRGVASRVVIAIRGPADRVDAHAWVEVEDRALLTPGPAGQARLAGPAGQARLAAL